MRCKHQVRLERDDRFYPPTITCGTKWVKQGGVWKLPTVVTFNTGSSFESYNRLNGLTHSGPPYRHGGAVSIWHCRDGLRQIQGQGTYYSSTLFSPRKYEGGFVCSGTFGALTGITDPGKTGEPDSSYLEEYAAAQYGALAIAKHKPGQSIADLGVFVGELKDVPRMLRSTAKFFHDRWRSFGSRSLANQWLNTQFGWLPFVSDLRKFYHAWHNADRMYNHIQRNNAVWKKEGGPVYGNSSETILATTTTTRHSPILESHYYQGSSGSSQTVFSLDDKVWFVGRFRYYIPDIGSVAWKRRAKAALFGYRPTPDMIWELTPWSWLIDWFIEADSVLQNCDSGWAENLVMKDAYVMRERVKRWTVNSVHNFAYCPPIQNSWSCELTCKSRAIASPFGFGMTPGNLSGRQASILAALGISRIW